jgi:hypothetical protein
MTKRFTSDVDIDFGDRTKIIALLDVTAAGSRSGGPVKRHNSGVYPTNIPYDPVHDQAAIDYVAAEARGYVKLDFLNLGVYEKIKDEAHLISLMTEPDWSLLTDRAVCEKLIHVSSYYDTIASLAEPINSIPRLAMFIALIRPGKKHLMGKTWKEIAETIWIKDEAGYTFKKSHAIAYAHLVVVQMNLLKP